VPTKTKKLPHPTSIQHKGILKPIRRSQRRTHTHTTVLRLFGFCPGQPDEPVPEETFTTPMQTLTATMIPLHCLEILWQSVLEQRSKSS